MSRKLFVAYVRIVTDRQGRFDFCLGVQLKAVAEYLDGGERELVGIYTELESGERCDRPELARALEACRRQNATLIVAKADSLSCDASFLHMIFDTAADCEVGFCEPLQRPSGRTGKSLTTRIAKQRAIGRADAVNRRLADQRAADILPVIRSIRTSGVKTLQGLADALNARGIQTARGARWYPTTVRNVLRRKLSGARQAVGDPECFSGVSAWRADSNASRPSVLN